ncbi:hypothetical protein ES703_59783 [subsurface metagenome]
MQPLRIAAAEHQPAGKLINNNNLAILDHILTVFLVQHLGFEGTIQIAGEGVI